MEVHARLTARGNEVTVRWVPAHSGVMGNEIVDSFAREVASSRQSQRHRVPDGLLQEANLSHLARAATENRSRATARRTAEHVRPERRHRPPAGTGLRRKALRRVRKSLASRYYQLLTWNAVTGSFLHERMTGPSRWRRANAGGAAVEEGRKGLGVEASKGTGGTEVVERGGHRGSARVLKGHPGWVLDGVPGSGKASGGGRPWRWGGRGRSGAALETSFQAFSGGAEDCLWSGDMYRCFCTGSFLFSFSSFLCFLISRFTWFAAGRLTGEQESGVPRFDSQ